MVTRDVPDHALVYGNPAKMHGYVCEFSEKLGETLKCPVCTKEYYKDKKMIFLK